MSSPTYFNFEYFYLLTLIIILPTIVYTLFNIGKKREIISQTIL